MTHEIAAHIKYLKKKIILPTKSMAERKSENLTRPGSNWKKCVWLLNEWIIGIFDLVSALGTFINEKNKVLNWMKCVHI